ncbi:hypothetical protein J3R83DRAFT_2376 [Lanmaoa asiatica]|nr:hypothetical protein J3R83DRAFT_2376 [Lanmaoa asiatica]
MSQPPESFYDYSQTQLGGGRRQPSPVIETPTKLRTKLKPTARDGGLVSGAQSCRAKTAAGADAIPLESPPSEGAHDAYKVLSAFSCPPSLQFHPLLASCLFLVSLLFYPDHPLHFHFALFPKRSVLLSQSPLVSRQLFASTLFHLQNSQLM